MLRIILVSLRLCFLKAFIASMKEKLFVNILFAFLTIPLVFLAVNFYLGTHEDAIERFDNHAFSIIFGRLCLASIVLLIIILLCIFIELFCNICKKNKQHFRYYLRKALFLYSIGICYALLLLLYEFLTTGVIAQIPFGTLGEFTFLRL